MDEVQIVAMITTLVECLKSNEVQLPAFIAQRYKANLELAKKELGIAELGS